MHPNPSPQLLLVKKYNALLTRFALRLTGGNFRLADDTVTEAMQEAYEEGIFYDNKELRMHLKNKIITKLKQGPGCSVPK